MAKDLFQYDERRNVARIFIRVTPGASLDEIAGIWRGPDGGRKLNLRVSARPDKGKANDAVINLLSKQLGLQRSSISITAGQTARLKTVSINENARAVRAAVTKITGEEI